MFRSGGITLGKKGYFTQKTSLVKRFTIGYFDRRFEISNMRSPDGVVCVSELMRLRGIELGLDESRLAVVRGGSEVDVIEFFEETVGKGELGLNREVMTFGSINIQEDEFSFCWDKFSSLVSCVLQSCV